MGDMHMYEDGHLTVDTEADAAYLDLTGVGEVDRTVMFNTDINVDVDMAGHAIGIELLHLGADVPVAALCERFNLDPEDLDPLVHLPEM